MGIVTILILIDGFLQLNKGIKYEKRLFVTILILIDGFLQYVYLTKKNKLDMSQSLF